MDLSNNGSSNYTNESFPDLSFPVGGSLIHKQSINYGVQTITYSGGLITSYGRCNDHSTTLTVILASTDPNDHPSQLVVIERRTDNTPLQVESTATNTVNLNASYTLNGKTVYYAIGMINAGYGTLELSGPYTEYDESNSIGISAAQLAWFMAYGRPDGQTVSIPVQWLSPNGNTFEDSFSITVH